MPPLPPASSTMSVQPQRRSSVAPPSPGNIPPLPPSSTTSNQPQHPITQPPLQSDSEKMVSPGKNHPLPPSSMSNQPQHPIITPLSRSDSEKTPPLPPSSTMSNQSQHPITPTLSQSDSEKMVSPTSSTISPTGFIPYSPPTSSPAGKVCDPRIYPGFYPALPSAAFHPLEVQSLSNSRPLVVRSASAASFFSDTAIAAPTSAYKEVICGSHPTTRPFPYEGQRNDPHVLEMSNAGNGHQPMNEERDGSHYQGRDADESQRPPKMPDDLQRAPVTTKFFDSVSTLVGAIPGLAVFALPLASIVLSSNMRNLHGQCISLNHLATGFVIAIVMACALFIGNHLAGHCLISLGKATGTEDTVFDVEKNRRSFIFFLCVLLVATLLLLAGFILFVQIVFGTGFCHLLGGIFTICSSVLLVAAFSPGVYGIVYFIRFTLRRGG